MKRILCLTSLLVTLALGGCVTPPVTAPEYRQLFLGPKAKSYIQTTALLQKRTEGNLLRAAYDGMSLYNRDIKYRFSWLDQSGFELPGITGRWQTRALQSEQPFQLQSIATNPKAVSFRLLIYDLHTQVAEQTSN